MAPMGIEPTTLAPREVKTFLILLTFHLTGLKTVTLGLTSPLLLLTHGYEHLIKLMYYLDFQK